MLWPPLQAGRARTHTLAGHPSDCCTPQLKGMAGEATVPYTQGGGFEPSAPQHQRLCYLSRLFRQLGVLCGKKASRKRVHKRRQRSQMSAAFSASSASGQGNKQGQALSGQSVRAGDKLDKLVPSAGQRHPSHKSTHVAILPAAAAPTCTACRSRWAHTPGGGTRSYGRSAPDGPRMGTR